MSATWPSALPLPLLEGYELKPKSGVVRTPMEAGPARQRRRFRRTPTMIPQSWLMTRSEFGLFELWFSDAIDGGAAWFDGPAANGTGLPTVQLQFVGGADREPYTAKPVGGGLWRVTATLEVREMPVGKLLDYWPAGTPSLDLDFLTQTYGVAGWTT